MVVHAAGPFQRRAECAVLEAALDTKVQSPQIHDDIFDVLLLQGDSCAYMCEDVQHKLPNGGVLCNYYVQIISSGVECKHLIKYLLFLYSNLLHSSINCYMLEENKKNMQL